MTGFAKSVGRHLRWNLAYARELVRDVPPELWTQGRAPGLENHPAWTIGHLITGAALTAADLGRPRELPPGWRDLFERRGPGDPRLPDRTAEYPSAETLLDELEALHDRIREGLASIDAERLAQREEWRFDSLLPTLRDSTLFMTIAHESMHLGQLAAWRRAHGLPSALGRMPR